MDSNRVSKWLASFGALIAVWLLAPIFVVIPIGFTGVRSFRFPPPSWSLRWYHNFFSNGDWLGSAATSLEIACVASLIATALGTSAAYGLARTSFPGKRAIQALLIAPMIVPVVITAIGTYAVFLQWRLLGSFAGFVIAHVILAIPLVVITVGSALAQSDWRNEDAAAICGAGPFNTFRLITLPSIFPAVATAAVLAFITSFDEVVVAIFLASPDLRTLPVQLYNSMIQQVDPTVAVAATLMLILTGVASGVVFSRRPESLT